MNGNLSGIIYKLLPQLYIKAGFFYDYWLNSQRYDLVQDTILKALSSDKCPETQDEIMGWMFMIMKNHFINTQLKQNRDGVRNVIYLELYAPEPNRILTDIEIEDLYTAIDHLTENQRIVVKMRLEGFNYKEISKITSIPVGSAKVTYVQSKAKLAKMLR